MGGEPPIPVILLVGPTGSGKSSFIKSLTTDRSIETSGSKPCTKRCKTYNLEVNIGRSVRKFTLIDTPGFGDSPEDNLVVLRQISRTLVDMLPQQVAGAIYFHSITDGRLMGTTKSVLSIFKALCGERFYSHAVVVTTMWDMIGDGKRTKYERINDELEAGHMRLSPDGPGIFKRLRNDAENSLKVLAHFATRSRAIPPTLLLVKQLRGSVKVDVRKTSAGKEILRRTNFGENKFCTFL